MTASEKLQQLVSEGNLTETQEDNLLAFNVYQVSHAKELFESMLSDNNSGLSNEDIITTLYNLLEFSESEWVVCGGYDGTVELLDMDTLQDILDD